MPPESQWLLCTVLKSQQRYALALSKFPNLDALERIERPPRFIGLDQYPPAVRGLLQARQ